MAAKVILVVCAQTLLIQMALTQYTSFEAVDPSILAATCDWPGSNFEAADFGYTGFTPLAYEDLTWTGTPLAYNRCLGEFTPTNGGGLPVTSISPIYPTGIAVISDNAYQGPVSVVGELPFLSAVVMEGVLPTAGSGAINHACGNGVTAMISEGIVPPAFGASFGPLGYSPAGFGSLGVAPAMAPGRFGFGACGRRLLY